MNSYSMTYTGRIVALISALTFLFGIDVDQGHLTEIVQAAVFLAGEAFTFYGRWRAGGVTWWGTRK